MIVPEAHVNDMSKRDREFSIGVVHYNMEAYGEN